MRFLALPTLLAVVLLLAACGWSESPEETSTVPAPPPPNASSAATAAITPSVTSVPSSPTAVTTYTDPFEYCNAVGTIDHLDRRWAGRDSPPELVALLEASGRQTFGNDARWRCVDGQVWACAQVTNVNCGLADTSQVPTAQMRGWCNSSTMPGIPFGVTGFATIYAWDCVNGEPVITATAWTVDPRGFTAENWHRLESSAPNIPQSTHEEAMRHYIATTHGVSPEQIITGPSFPSCPNFATTPGAVCFVLAESRDNAVLYNYGPYGVGAASPFVVLRDGEWTVLDHGCDWATGVCPWPVE